jgi:tetratricopeptide (TPR) repeat protein
MDKNQTEKPEGRLSAEMHFQRGRQLFNVRKYEEALVAFEEAVATDPTFVRAYAGKANALTVLGRLDEALRACEEAVRLDPSYPVIYTMRGAVFRAQGREREANADYELAEKLGPDDPLVHFNYACFWAHMGRRDDCERELKRALELDPALNSAAAIDPDFEPYRGEEWFEELVAFK